MERRHQQRRSRANMNNNNTNNIASGEDHGLSFPLKLHAMLEDAESKEFNTVVSWQAGDKSFKVHDVNKFGSEIMP